MPDLWILMALLAMLANVAKVWLVKTCCAEVASTQLLLVSRLFPAVCLLPLLWLLEFEILNVMQFWVATVGAAVLTLAASWLYLEAVKQGALSLVTPIQATVPLFMMLCIFVLDGSLPPPQAMGFIVAIVVSVGVVLRTNQRHAESTGQGRAVLYSLLAAALFGVSTVLDKMAIAASTHGALVFTACWHWVTLALLLPLMWVKGHSMSCDVLLQSGVRFYVLMVLLAFLAQQYAVQASLHLDHGVTYVKTIVMMHLVMAAALGIGCLQERNNWSVWLANGVTMFSGIGLLWSI